MYSFNERIKHSQISEYGDLTFTSAMRLLVDCCTFQSEDAGFGIDYLDAHNEGWYVVSWQVKVNYMPHHGQKVVVKTMPYKIAGMMGFRNFSIDTEDGLNCLQVDSTWVYMNLDKKKPARICSQMVEGFNIVDTPLEVEWMPRKIEVSQTLIDKMAEDKYDSFFQVKKMHLDTNHHMNNSMYIEETMEFVPDKARINYVRAEYKQVAYLGDKVKLACENIDGGIAVCLYDGSGDEVKEYATVEVYYD